MAETVHDIIGIERQSLIDLLSLGYSIELGKISLCVVKDYYKDDAFKWKFQVFCDDYRKQYTCWHNDPKKAVDEFLKIKGDLYERHSRHASS